MIGAQASILAIVISVTLISTQLVATRYAPRMATLPFRTLLFKGAFFLFAASIVLDVLLLVSISTSNAFYSAMLFVAVGLFFTVLLFLYFFVRGMVEHTSPENLVTLFTETVSVDEYLSRSQALADAPEQNAHPLQPLYRFIMSALSQNEHGTAQAALDQYHQYASQILQELDDTGIFRNEVPDCGDELFGPVVKDHLHSITIHAAEQDESQILSSAVGAQVALAKQGMEIGEKTKVPGQALWGIRRTIIETPVTPEDYVTFNRTWKAVTDLMLEETNYEQHRVLLSGQNVINGRLETSLNRSKEPRWHTDALRQSHDNLCKAHTSVLEQIANGPGFDEIDLSKIPNGEDVPAADRVKQARLSKDAIYSMTSTFLQFRIDKGFWPVTLGNFHTQWTNMCTEAASQGADDHATRLCQALIEMAFLENSHRPYEQSSSSPNGDNLETDYLFWANELASVQEDTSKSVLEQAFDKILQYEYKEGPTPILFAGEHEKVKQEYYFPELPITERRALNTYPQFPELVQELRTYSLSE